jgi:transposase
MEKATRRRYRLEYKQEAVRLVASGQKVAAAAKALGIVEQTLADWVKADRAGQLRGLSSEQLSAERMENIPIERLHGMEFQNHREAKDATLDWLLWYNGSRMHSTLNYLSPSQFEQQADAQKTALAA